MIEVGKFLNNGKNYQETRQKKRHTTYSRTKSNVVRQKIIQLWKNFPHDYNIGKTRRRTMMHKSQVEPVPPSDVPNLDFITTGKLFIIGKIFQYLVPSTIRDTGVLGKFLNFSKIYPLLRGNKLDEKYLSKYNIPFSN